MTELVAYRNIGKPDSETLAGYLRNGGYHTLAKLLREMTPEQVIETIKESGLRGCGGAGFPTGTKWQFVRQATGRLKYVVCNADEGEPGTFKDRAILEHDPHLLIEGILIAGYATGAEAGYIYIRGEYEPGWLALKRAIAEALGAGYLGDAVCGTSFGFQLGLRRGAGSYVCGEETALLSSLEGKRGIPRLRPPYPANEGLWGKPTLINNVETLARVPTIMEKGAAWYRGLGLNGAAGTKLYSLSGHVRRPGAYELPAGITTRTLVYEHGGGMRDNRALKGFCPGGISSGVLSADLIDVPLDYEPLAKAGSMLGSAAVIAMDETTCMVDVAIQAARFYVHESCGECTPCRLGNERVLELLTKIVVGAGSWHDVHTLQELGEQIRGDARCGLGQAAPLMLLSTLGRFSKDYQIHIEEQRCPTGACSLRHLDKRPQGVMAR